MAKVYLGLGSNVEPQRNLRLGIRELARRFGDLELSNLYSNASVGFDGDEFINLVVGLETDATPQEIHDAIEVIHVLARRPAQRIPDLRRARSISICCYMTIWYWMIRRFGVPRADILKYSFVLGPLAEIAPQLRHPETGKLITEHWAEFDQNSHPLAATSVKLV